MCHSFNPDLVHKNLNQELCRNIVAYNYYKICDYMYIRDLFYCYSHGQRV